MLAKERGDYRGFGYRGSEGLQQHENSAIVLVDYIVPGGQIRKKRTALLFLLLGGTLFEGEVSVFRSFLFLFWSSSFLFPAIFGAK